MNKATIFIRTAKGTREFSPGSHDLARDLRIILNAIDGKSSVEALRSKFDFLSADEVDEALLALVGEDLIRESASSTSAFVSSAQPILVDAASDESLRKAEALRAKIRGRREGAERRSAAEPVTSDRQSEEQVRRDAEEEARREAERARQEAEAQARRVAEERMLREAEEQARRHVEEEAIREEAERARQEAAERARLDAEAQARWMAEQQAWLASEENLRAEQEATASKRAKAREAADEGTDSSGTLLKWGKVLALGIVVLVLVGLVVIHSISFDGQIPQFEKSLAGQFQQPVKIKALRLSLVPHSHLRIEGVSIGSEGQIRVSQIKASGALGNLFSDRKVFTSLELVSPVVTEEGLGWILFGKPLASTIEYGRVSVLNASLESKNVSLPAFDARLLFDSEGTLKSVAVESVDQNISLELTPKDRSVQIDVKAKMFRIPFGSALTLEELVAKGTTDGSELVLTEFKGFVYGGILGGNARLKWGSNWSLAGELNAKQIDTSRLVPGVLDGGRLAGAASYVMQASESVKLFAALRLEGSFVVPWGTLLGVDLGNVLQGGATRGDTKFSELSGSFVHDQGATQFRQVRLSQGTLSANGMADVDPDRNVRGRLAADLKLSSGQRHANLAISGTLEKIEWRRQ